VELDDLMPVSPFYLYNSSSSDSPKSISLSPDKSKGYIRTSYVNDTSRDNYMLIVGLNNQFVGGIVGMITLAVLSIPLMRWSVCLLGAAAGGIITSGIWYACGLTEQYLWAGGLIGVVAGGMISFIIFKAAVILFSSLWGSGLVVIGSLALLYLYPRTSAKIEELVFSLRWFLPTIIAAPTAIGFVLQHKFLKSSKDYNL
jgi:hypothetical protein